MLSCYLCVLSDYPWTTAYIVAHIFSFLLIKYYYLADLFRTKNDAKINKNFAPFIRSDLDKLGLISCFPWYFTYLPRLIAGWLSICSLGVVTAIIAWGGDCSNLDPTRQWMIK